MCKVAATKIDQKIRPRFNETATLLQRQEVVEILRRLVKSHGKFRPN